MSFFETVVAMAFAAFSNAPVDVAVVEVGMGGCWDATNVADGHGGGDPPIAVDHASYLGSRPVDIAREKAGIIKPGSTVVCAQQYEDVRGRRCRARSGGRGRAAARGRRLRHRPGCRPSAARCCGFRVCDGEYDEVFLPLHGAHQAQNAVIALAAVESFLGGESLAVDLVRGAFEEVTSPGRLEVIRRSPTIILDAAHNPHGAEAVVAAMDDSFLLDPLIGVVGVMADKDHEGLLAALEPAMAAVVCTQSNSTRAMPVEELAETARGIFGHTGSRSDRRLDDALDRAATLAEEGGVFGEAIGSGGVLVTGSVVTVGEARQMLSPGGPMSRSIRRSLCAAMLTLQAIVLFLTGVVTIGITDLGTSTALAVGGGLAVACRSSRTARPARRVRPRLGDACLDRPRSWSAVGAVFAVLWATAYILGARIDPSAPSCGVEGPPCRRAGVEGTDHGAEPGAGARSFRPVPRPGGPSPSAAMSSSAPWSC